MRAASTGICGNPMSKPEGFDGRYVKKCERYLANSSLNDHAPHEKRKKKERENAKEWNGIYADTRLLDRAQ